MAPAKRRRLDATGAAGAEADEAGGAAAPVDEEDEDASGASDDDRAPGDAAEEEVLLPGADDPSYAEQYALWKDGLFIDIWLQAGEEGAPEGARVPASRMLLASVSPYIRKLLLGTQQIPGLTGDTIHVGVPGGADALAQLVEALYRRRMRLAMHGPCSVLDVLRVANFLHVAVVNDAARGYLAAHLAPHNALRVAALAEAHGLEDARAVAMTYAADHFGELVAQGGRRHGLSRVDEATLRTLLASDALRVDGELDVFCALMAWLNARERGSGAPLATAAAPAGGPSAEESNAPPAAPSPCPPDLLALIRLQHIPLEQLYAVVVPHPRMQAAAVKSTLIDTFAYHALSAELTAAAVAPQPPRRYSLVDPRTVHLNVTLRVRDGEERVRQLCDSLPADNPIKFVAKMRATIGARGVLVAKSRRGSLKLRFDHLDLAEDKREFWYPAEALTW